MDDPKIKIIVLAFVTLIFSAFILAGIYPYHPNSYFGWLFLYFMSLPLVIIFEILGEKLFFNKITNKIGRTGRFIYGVIVLGLFMLLSSSSLSLMKPYLGKWGS